MTSIKDTVLVFKRANHHFSLFLSLSLFHEDVVCIHQSTPREGLFSSRQTDDMLCQAPPHPPTHPTLFQTTHFSKIIHGPCTVIASPIPGNLYWLKSPINEFLDECYGVVIFGWANSYAQQNNLCSWRARQIELLESLIHVKSNKKIMIFQEQLFTLNTCAGKKINSHEEFNKCHKKKKTKY